MSLNLENFKLLVVGAGGIGCELLKNLVLTGFSQIEVIDLDTIELSNLNRQFLFQKVHVGKPKAIIARESVLKYNPSANIVAYHDTIMNTKYNVEYFKQFDIVLNALDNKAARSHVNRLCLAADVPLIESGSAGYLGQVTLIKKGLTECYDCLPKPPVKSFPGCTIRNTPSEPIHCIVWAKHLFNQLFGAEDPDEAVSPDGEDPENMENAGQNALEKTEHQEPVVRVSTRQWAKETNFDSSKLFNKLFNDDIKYLLSMSKLWEKRKPPNPLDWNESIQNDKIPIINDETNQGKSSGNGGTTSNAQKNDQNANTFSSLRLWSVSECCQVFSQSVKALRTKLEEQVDCENPMLCWDKDDEDAMNFVAAAANLRCFIFSINIKSKFEIKSLAGNIIPAIATTNAIVAGLIVLQALKVLKNKLNECKTVFLRDKAIKSRIIVGSELVKPNEKCYVCASKAEISVKLNLLQFTVKQFETKILKQELNMVQPDVEIDDGTGRIIISSEEGETEENNDKTLSYFGLTDQSNLKCDDFFQNFELKITLYQCDKFDPQNTKEYELIADNQMLKDIQEQIKKENDQKSSTDQAAAPVTHVSPNQEAAEKKRRYEQAFCDEEVTSSSGAGSVEAVSNLTKKLKSSENSTNSIDQLQSDEKQQQQQIEDNASCASNSINDASDALSDEDYQLIQKKERDTIQKDNGGGEENAILVDDDCIIEENSNDLVNEGNSNSLSPTNNNGNGVLTEEDDDIIECSGDEDIIEINDDSENNVNEKSNSNKLCTYQMESNGNNHAGHLQIESENDSVEIFKHKKILAANNLNGQNHNNINTNGNGNGHLDTNGNGNGKHSNEEEDGITLID